MKTALLVLALAVPFTTAACKQTAETKADGQKSYSTAGTIKSFGENKSYANITQKYPDAITAERIVFVKGKVDKKRETPSLMVSEILPVEAA